MSEQKPYIEEYQAALFRAATKAAKMVEHYIDAQGKTTTDERRSTDVALKLLSIMSYAPESENE